MPSKWISFQGPKADRSMDEGQWHSLSQTQMAEMLTSFSQDEPISSRTCEGHYGPEPASRNGQHLPSPEPGTRLPKDRYGIYNEDI